MKSSSSWSNRERNSIGSAHVRLASSFSSTSGSVSTKLALSSSHNLRCPEKRRRASSGRSSRTTDTRSSVGSSASLRYLLSKKSCSTMTGRLARRSGPRTRSKASQTVDLPTLFGPTRRVCSAKSTTPCRMPRKFSMVIRLARIECVLPSVLAHATGAVPRSVDRLSAGVSFWPVLSQV